MRLAIIITDNPGGHSAWTFCPERGRLLVAPGKTPWEAVEALCGMVGLDRSRSTLSAALDAALAARKVP